MDNVIQHIKIEDIVPRNYHNPNDMIALQELAISIKNHGIKEPLKLKKNNDRYEIISGNKRYKAAILAGLSKVPAIIEDSDSNYLLKYITGNDNKYPISINNNSDIINLSELNKEYERDDFKMNNELINNNPMSEQPNNNAGLTPSFGERFFPSLEDEPTNIAFNTTIEPTPEITQMNQPTNNFIDLTSGDNNIQNQILPEQPQNINQNNNEVQPNFGIQSDNVINNNTMPEATNNVLNLENLTQNNNMVNQPQLDQIGLTPAFENIPQQEQPQPIIDNNFQEIVSDFQPNIVQPMNIPYQEQPILENPVVENPVVMEQISQVINNDNQMMNEQINIPQNDIAYQFNQPISSPMYTNIQDQNSLEQPVNIMPNAENIPQPSMVISQEQIQPESVILAQPVENIINQPQPELINQNPKKDILPVINTLKAVSVNLENFGYTIRITDEDLPNSYKITIEIDK